MLFLLRELERRRPSLVVELGSGLSTVLLAAKLREMGHGRIVSIDHEADYAERTRSWLEMNGVADLVELRVAPLDPRPGAPPEAPPWYDEGVLEDLHAVDVLIVDGPPMPVHEHVRGPALDFFQKRFSADWLAFLDDADRRGEQQLVKKWTMNNPNVSFSYLPFAKGAFIFTSQ